MSNIIPFSSTGSTTLEDPQVVPSERYWDPDEVQAVIREAFRRGVDPTELFDSPDLEPAA